MSTIVGSLAVELGLDTAKYEASAKKVGATSQQSFQQMSAAAKQATREGAESLRIFDESLGLHISRPIAKILAKDFPDLAKGLQSVLSIGVAVGVGLAVFDFIAKGIERIGKAVEDAKKKQEEFIASTHALNMALNEESIKTANALDQVKEKLAELSGDKSGALAARLRIIDRTDAEEAARSIDIISEAFTRQAKAAIEAASATNRFWVEMGHLTESAFAEKQEEIVKKNQEIKNSFDEITTTKGLKAGSAFLNDELAKQSAILKNMSTNVVGSVDETLAKIVPMLDTYVVKHGAATKEIIIQQTALVNSLQKQVELTKALIAIDEGHKTVAKTESAEQRDIGEKQLTKLRAETDAELALASATTKSTAEQKLAAAQGQADVLLAGIQEAAHGRLTNQVRQEMLAVAGLEAARAVAKETVSTNDSLEKSLESTREATASANELAAAYAQGGTALEAAQVDAKLKSQVEEVQRLRDLYNLTKKAADEYAASAASLGKQAGPKPGLDISEAQISKLAAGLAAAQAKLDELRTAQAALDQAKYNEELSKSEAALKGEQPLLDALNKAYGENEVAVRRAQTALALYHWEQAHPGATQDEIDRENRLLEQQAIDAQRAADAKAAGSYDIATLYQNEIDKLLRIREVLQANGADTILIDAKIHDAQDALIHQWDEAALKVGTFHDKFQATMNEVILKGQQAAQEMGKAWIGAIDGINANMAKLLTGQKTDFGKVFQELAQKQTEAQLAQIEGGIAGKFGLNIPGLQGKPDGTATNPLHVAIVSGGSTATAGVGAAGVSGGASAPATGNPIAPAPGSAVNSFASTLLSSFFGGGLASGGRAEAGKAYLVGERGPELFTPGGSGGSITASQNFQFGPSNRDYPAYMAYERWLHRGPSNAPFWESLGTLGFGMFLNKVFGKPTGTPPMNTGSVAANLPAQTGALADLDALTASGSGSGILPSTPPAPDVMARSDLDALTASAASPTLSLPGLAAGGSVRAGSSYVVGENGPEIFRPSEHGEIIPNHAIDFSGYMADGGDVFAGKSYMVGERGREIFAPSNVSNAVTKTTNRGGDVHNTINFNGRGDPVDLFRKTSKHDMDRLFARMKRS